MLLQKTSRNTAFFKKGNDGKTSNDTAATDTGNSNTFIGRAAKRKANDRIAAIRELQKAQRRARAVRQLERKALNSRFDFQAELERSVRRDKWQSEGRCTYTPEYLDRVNEELEAAAHQWIDTSCQLAIAQEAVQ